ncbi:hypothetical protein OK016_13880 [Vibrio chagasii]|nr:hypothetical protein [Vibrio chagasii]
MAASTLQSSSRKSRIRNENCLVAGAVVLLAGCSAPANIQETHCQKRNNIKNITIVEDTKTRTVFLDSMLD